MWPLPAALTCGSLSVGALHQALPAPDPANATQPLRAHHARCLPEGSVPSRYCAVSRRNSTTGWGRYPQRRGNPLNPSGSTAPVPLAHFLACVLSARAALFDEVATLPPGLGDGQGPCRRMTWLSNHEMRNEHMTPSITTAELSDTDLIASFLRARKGQSTEERAADCVFRRS